MKKPFLMLSLVGMLVFGASQLVAGPYSTRAMCVIGCITSTSYSTTACNTLCGTCNDPAWGNGFPSPTPYEMCIVGCVQTGTSDCSTECAGCPD